MLLGVQWVPLIDHIISDWETYKLAECVIFTQSPRFITINVLFTAINYLRRSGYLCSYKMVQSTILVINHYFGDELI